MRDYEYTKLFFRKHQKRLLWFVNSFVGKWWFGIYKDEQSGKKKNINPIFLLTPAGYGYCGELKKKNDKWVQEKHYVFYGSGQHAESLNRIFTLARWLYFPFALLKPATVPLLGFALTTNNYQPTTNTDGDYYNGEYSGDTSWANVHDASSAYYDEYGGQTQVLFSWEQYSAGHFVCARGIMNLDTSGIDDSETVTAASLYVKININNHTGTNTSLSLVQNTMTNVSLATEGAGGFSECGTTKGMTDIGTASLATGWNWQQMDLNATGLGWISKTGYTQFAFRAAADISNTAPGSGDMQYWNFYPFTNSTPGNRPYITVTSQGAAGNLRMLMGIGT